MGLISVTERQPLSFDIVSPIPELFFFTKIIKLIQTPVNGGQIFPVTLDPASLVDHAVYNELCATAWIHSLNNAVFIEGRPRY